MKRILSAVLALVLSLGLLTLPASAAISPAAEVRNAMPLREKITQMLMVDFRNWDGEPFTVMNDQVRNIVSNYKFGAVIYFAQNLTDTQQAFELTMQLQKAAVSKGGLPMLIAADQEGGSVYRLGTGTALPGNMALGAAGDPEYAKLAGEIIGSELSALGINTNLAPVVDINSNANNPVIGLRSFGDDPIQPGYLARALIGGMEAYNVIACMKHFPGHGDTATDSHYGLPMVDKSLEQLRQCELVPFQTVIDQGIDMVMTAHILYPQLEQDTVRSHKTGKEEFLPATLSDDIITGLLKGEMGFDGIVVTDAMNMAGIADTWDPVQAAVLAIQAGADMICMPCTLSCADDLAQLDSIIAGIEAAVEDGTIPMSRIDDAVLNILEVKDYRGILRWSEENYSLEQAQAMVGCEANRQAERQIAAAAVTVVQNKENTLPLTITAESKVLMLVPYDNERAQMLLGWNRAAEAGLIPEGAQVSVVRFSDADTLDTLKGEIDWADTVILTSEISSAAAMNGGSWRSAIPLAVVDHAENQGKITVVQSVDKPYDVQSYPNADAVLAVYGCKGSSIDPTEALTGGMTGSQAAYGPNLIAGVEVMLGVFPAQGTLPVDIPRFADGTYTDEIVFPRGFGLTYDSLLLEPKPEAPLQEPDAPVESTSPPEQLSTPVAVNPGPGYLIVLIPCLLLGGLAIFSLFHVRRRGRRERRSGRRE